MVLFQIIIIQIMVKKNKKKHVFGPKGKAVTVNLGVKGFTIATDRALSVRTVGRYFVNKCNYL